MFLKVEVVFLKCFGSDLLFGEIRVMFKFNEFFVDNWIGFFRDGKNVLDGCLRRFLLCVVMVNDFELNIINFGFSLIELLFFLDFVLDVGGVGVGFRVEFFRKVSSIFEFNCCFIILWLCLLLK